MQPCAVCGGVTINATGHCTQCGTFRGNAPQAPAGGYGGYPPPAAGPAYNPPMSGGPGYGQQPVSGYPMSAPPGGYPASGGPAYGQPPTSGGGYPAAYPPPPGLGNNGNKAKPFVVPLVALSATLVVLVVAIVIVVLVRSGGDPTTPVAGKTPTVAPTEAANPDVDPCVVGRWRVKSHREDVPMDGVGEVEFTGGSGAIIDLAADGTGTTTYRGTTYEGVVEGKDVALKLNGTIKYDFTARDGTVSFANLKAEGTATVYIAGDQIDEPEALTGDDDPAKYTCLGTSMTQSTQLYETQLTKVG